MTKRLLLRGIWSLGLILLLVGLVSVGIGAKGCERAFNKDDDDDVIITGSSAAVNAPSNLAANPVSSTAVALTWTDNSNNETGFKLERSDTGIAGIYNEIVSPTVNTTAYTNTGLSAANIYHYRLKAYESTDSLESNYSSAVGTLTHGVWSATTMTDTTPISRAGHTQVWTGAEMIVWGGWDGQNTLYTGAVYSPTLSTWTAITTDGAPASRTAHTAIWTGSKMIIWGGYTVASSDTQTIDNCETAWLSDATDVTTDISTDEKEGTYSVSIDIATAFTNGLIAHDELPAPINISARTSVSFWIRASDNIPSGVLSLVLDDTKACTSTLEDMSINTTLNAGAWTLVTLSLSNPALLTEIVAVGLKANTDPGTVIILIDNIGASGGGTTYYNDGSVYDPAAKSWTGLPPTNAPEVRAYHSAVWTGSKMIIWGGKSSSSYKNGGVYNPNTGVWEIGWQLDNLRNGTHPYNPSSRSKHMAIWTGGDGSESWHKKMIIWGGEGGGTTGAIYDLVDIWSQMTTTNAPSVRWGFSDVWTGAGSESWRNKIIVWGGYNGTELLNTGGIYNPALNSWTSLPTTNAPVKRRYHSGIWTGTRMIVWGGDGITKVGGVYEPSSSQWTTTSTLDAPSARLYHRGIWDNVNNQMIIWGGWDGNEYFNTGGTYTSQ